MDHKPEVMPCPFCGNDELTAEPDTTYVMCHGCDADGPMTKPGGAIKAWNTRTAPAEDVRAVPEEGPLQRAWKAGYDTGYYVKNPCHDREFVPSEHVRSVVEEPLPFQYRVKPWMAECFGPEISGDQQERNHRFLEEALELVQACGATASEAHQLVDYVYGRPVGDKIQEIGGVMVTLAALCLAHGLNMHLAGESELQRIWTKVDQIREKQAAKPKHSPLPQ